MTTEQIWTATHKALFACRWSEARALLDDLARRDDLAAGLTADYVLPTGEHRAVIADRIDLVNAKAGAR